MSILNLDDKTVSVFQEKTGSHLACPKAQKPTKAGCAQGNCRGRLGSFNMGCIHGREQDIEWEKSLGPGHRVWSL